MRFTELTPILLGTCLLLFLTGCGGSANGVRIIQGDTPVGKASAKVASPKSVATIVHVDMFERITTIRRGNDLPSGFLIATSRGGVQTAVLKARPSRPEGLRTADILEGEPKINNLVIAASAEDTTRIAKIYRDAETE